MQTPTASALSTVTGLAVVNRLRSLVARCRIAVVAAGLMPMVWLGGAQAMTLQEAVAYAVSTNPEILAAAANRSAIDFELRQARGLYLPQLDLEGSIGPGWRDRPGSAGDDDHTILVRREVALTLQQMIFDGFATDSEVERQASRVDAAAARVLERSEFIAVNISQAYINILRQNELIGLAQQNIRIHQEILRDVQARVNAGRSSVADVQQTEERLRGAEATLIEIERSFEEARIDYQELVGLPAGQLSMPPQIDSSIPTAIDSAIEIALANNPTLSIARADIDTAYAQFRAANAAFWPTFDIEGRASTGIDIGGSRGPDSDIEALLVMRYNLYRGGIDTANREEQIRRIDEARQALLQFERSVQEIVRSSYNTLDRSQRRLILLREQVAVSEQVRDSYIDQFSIGERTLLDVLDAENALFNARVDLVNSEFDLMFSKYQIIGATGQFLTTFNIQPHPGAAAIARQDANVPATPESETMDRSDTRTSPSLLRGSSVITD